MGKTYDELLKLVLESKSNTMSKYDKARRRVEKAEKRFDAETQRVMNTFYKGSERCDMLLSDAEKISTQNPTHNDTTLDKKRTAKIIAATAVLTTTVGAGIAMLKKHGDKDAKKKALETQLKTLCDKATDISVHLKNGEIDTEDARKQIDRINKKLLITMKKLESLGISIEVI